MGDTTKIMWKVQGLFWLLSIFTLTLTEKVEDDGESRDSRSKTKNLKTFFLIFNALFMF